jgi:hypothetical protein
LFRKLIGLLALLLLLSPRAAHSDTFSDYQVSSSFTLPAGAQAFDVVAGRVIVSVGNTLRLETSPGSRTFTTLGTLSGADIPSFGPAFLRVSPDGQRVAIGNNGGASFFNYQVGVFLLSSLSGAWFNVSHYDAEWIDNRHLALTAGDFPNPSIVTALDTQSNPMAPANVTLVNNIGGASGGIAFDASGNLFTANGFATGGPSVTGAIRAFAAASWQAALAGGPPVNFETAGVPVITLFSGSPLTFDGSGNLFVGGTPDTSQGAFALVRASRVASAVAGGGAINPSDASAVRRFDPSSGASSTYSIAFNAVRAEVYARELGETSVAVLTAGPPMVAAVPALPLHYAGVLAALLASAALWSRGRAGARSSAKAMLREAA